MTAMGFVTGRTRIAACRMCGVDVEQREHRVLTINPEPEFGWLPQPHDAPCGQPCLGGTLRAEAKAVLVGKFKPWTHGAHGWKRDGKTRTCPKGCEVPQ